MLWIVCNIRKNLSSVIVAKLRILSIFAERYWKANQATWSHVLKWEKSLLGYRTLGCNLAKMLKYMVALKRGSHQIRCCARPAPRTSLEKFVIQSFKNAVVWKGAWDRIKRRTKIFDKYKYLFVKYFGFINIQSHWPIFYFQYSQLHHSGECIIFIILGGFPTKIKTKIRYLILWRYLNFIG